mmetsp:Transcript_12533/g.31611  ORF Transcript_12533/g.31611 Transcript_12533/m.31611 type:complete len:202 (-) Transcript_12533:132-737(-)
MQLLLRHQRSILLIQILVRVANASAASDPELAPGTLVGLLLGVFHSGMVALLLNVEGLFDQNVFSRLAGLHSHLEGGLMLLPQALESSRDLDRRFTSPATLFNQAELLFLSHLLGTLLPGIAQARLLHLPLFHLDPLFLFLFIVLGLRLAASLRAIRLYGSVHELAAAILHTAAQLPTDCHKLRWLVFVLLGRHVNRPPAC